MRVPSLPAHVSALLLVLAAAHAGADYPWLELAPSAPTTDDPLTLRLVLGGADSSCIPSYTGLSHTTTAGNPVDGLPGYTLALSYSVASAPCDTGTTLHGPEYSLGTLPVGHYLVVDSVSGLDLATFRVVQSGAVAFALTGTVVRDGPVPVPLAGALVSLHEPDVYYFPLGKAAKGMASQLEYRQVGMARTDSLGRFGFTNLDSGIYRVSARAEGHDSAWMQLAVYRNLQVAIPLVADGAVGAVRGRVMTAIHPDNPWLGYEPVAGCTVRVTVPVKDTGPVVTIPPRTRFIKGATDSAGYYFIDSVPASAMSRWPARVNHPGYLYVTDSVHVRTSDTTVVDFVLDLAYASQATITRDSIEYILASSKFVYARGEQVQLRYYAENHSSRDTALYFESYCRAVGVCHFAFVVLTTTGDTLLADPPGITCDSVIGPLRLGIPAYTRQSCGEWYFAAVDSHDTVVVRAWLRGYEQETALDLRVLFTPTSGVSPRPRQAGGRSSAHLYGDRLVLSLAEPQGVTVELLTPAGRMLGRRETQRLAAGAHCLALPARSGAAGLVVVRVRGQDLEFTGVRAGR